MATDIFTASGTWTCPTGVTSVDVECWAGGSTGGSGQGGGGAGSAGNGGAGGVAGSGEGGAGGKDEIWFACDSVAGSLFGGGEC